MRERLASRHVQVQDTANSLSIPVHLEYIYRNGMLVLVGVVVFGAVGVGVIGAVVVWWCMCIIVYRVEQECWPRLGSLFEVG